MVGTEPKANELRVVVGTKKKLEPKPYIYIHIYPSAPWGNGCGSLSFEFS